MSANDYSTDMLHCPQKSQSSAVNRSSSLRRNSSYQSGIVRIEDLGHSDLCCCPIVTPHPWQDAKSRCLFSYTRVSAKFSSSMRIPMFCKKTRSESVIILFVSAFGLCWKSAMPSCGTVVVSQQSTLLRNLLAPSRTSSLLIYPAGTRIEIVLAESRRGFPLFFDLGIL
jgi:hypothetical protein